jgi:hypothetical protein
MKLHLYHSPDPVTCSACGRACNRAIFIDGLPFGHDCGVKRLNWHCTPEQAHHKLFLMRQAQAAFAVALQGQIPSLVLSAAVTCSRVFGFGIAASDPGIVEKVKGLLS